MSQVVTDYGTHSCTREYSFVDIFCPTCGAKQVWEEQGGGDYYVGEEYLCLGCGATFNLPTVGPADKYAMQRVIQLRGIVSRQHAKEGK